MRKKVARHSARMPVLGGVVLPHGKSDRTLLRGVCVVDEKTAGRVQELFVDSARFTGSRPPKNFKMTAGEIFYEGGKIAEVRLKGRLPLAEDKEWDEFPTDEDIEEFGLTPAREGAEDVAWGWPSWSTGAFPDFSWIDDLRLAFSARDLGRPYVAALRIGGPLLLWWDVATGRVVPPPAGVDARLIRVARPPKKKTSGGRDDAVGFDAAIHYAEVLARSAGEMGALLELLRDGDELDFIDQRRAFGHAFEHLLKQRIANGGAGPMSFSMQAMGEAEMRRRVVSAVAGLARDHLFVRTGPKQGSETKKRKPSPEERALARKLNDERNRRMILQAIRAEYRKLCKRFPPAEAESRLKAIRVIARLGGSSRNFYYWLNRLGRNFDDLKTEVLKCARD